jgi:amino acid transporter/thiamine kinase-like enzyme
MANDRPAAQQLDASGISAFTSFALSLSTICILAGGITSFHVGLCSVGGAAIGIGWPVGCVFGLVVALTMGQLASAFPKAGGPYEWALKLGGRAWGWLTACFGLAGIVTVLAAINLATCQFIVRGMSRQLDIDPESFYPWLQVLAAVLMTASQALVNHLGIRLTAQLLNFSGYLILVMTFVLTAVVIVFGLVLPGQCDLARLVTFENFSGAASEPEVFPPTGSMALLFALGLMLPAYTVTGFDAPAQTAEETVNPRLNVPRGIVRSVIVSSVAGWVMLGALVLAAPPAEGGVAAAAATGPGAFHYIIRTAIPGGPGNLGHGLLYAGLVAAMYLCGLATLTSVSRLTFAFARDGGLPFSTWLKHIGSHRTPSGAIWASSAAASLFIVGLRYETIAAVCATLLYLAYVLPTALGAVARYRRTWTETPPWHVEPYFLPLAAVGVLWCAALIVIGMQPPNAIAAPIIGTAVVALLGLWFAYQRFHFQVLHLGDVVAPEAAGALAAQVPALGGQGMTVTLLGGGMTNRNYKVEAGGEAYVLRVAGAGTEQLGIDREREIACARAAAAAGVGPEVVCHLPEHGVTVTCFVHGKQLQAHDAREPKTLRRLAQALRSVHDHPPPEGVAPFNPFAIIRDYHARAGARSVPLPPELDRALELLAAIEKELDTGEPPCLCHNDLLPANFLDAGGMICIIDWEYGGRGDRFFDLGNFAVNHQLSPAEEVALLEAYFGAAQEEHVRRLLLMRLVSDLREATWGYLQAAVATVESPAYYTAYGRKHLDRFFAAIETICLT